MSFKFISDSCCDYGESIPELDGLKRVPLTIEIGEKKYVDDESLDTDLLLKDMRDSRTGAKTACPSPASYAEAYDCEQDDVYVVTLSEKLSGSYNSAVAGKALYEDRDRPKNIHIFNSRTAAAGQVAICMKIHELASQGKRFASVIAETERFIENLTTLFVLEDLENLRKNGRLNHLQSVITGVLRIRLVMGAERDGTIGIRGKAMATGSALAKMAELVRQKCSDVSALKRPLVISYCNCRERAEQVRNMIFSSCPFQRIELCRAGGITTVYANNGGIVLSF
jgi:DegV family protein with EDD domain